MENKNIQILWKFNHTEEYISRCYHNFFTRRGKKKPLFYLQPINDVFVFDRIYRCYEIAKGKGLFDKNVNFETAIKEYCNGFKKGYREFTNKVSNDLKYNEGTIFKNATRFYSPGSWYPHIYKEDKIIPQNWDVLGENIGRFYAAWCIVLEYQDNFEPMFEQLYTQQQTKELPKELQTNEASKFFAEAIKEGLMDDEYKWQKGLQLLACFASEMSKKLNIGKGKDSNGTVRIAWKPFEILFCIKRGKLRSNYNDIKKTGDNPIGATLIDKIFK